MNWMNKSRPNTVLGLTLDGGVLDAVQLRRSNGGVEVVKSLQAPLTLDPLRNEAELVGREVRKLLSGAGINEKRVVVGVPVGWILALLTVLPQIEETDLSSFLELEAERGFPCNVEELQMASQLHASPSGRRYASQIGVPRAHLTRLEAVLKAADLSPTSFSLGATALPGVQAQGAREQVVVVVGFSKVDMLITSGSGLLVIRALEGALDSEGAEERIQSELVAREIRVSLGQLPNEVREQIRKLTIVGSGQLARQLVEDIRPRADKLGLAVDQITHFTEPHFGLAIHGKGPVTPALSLAAQFLSGNKPAFEFLPPRPGYWKQISSRYSSKRLVYAGGAATAVFLATASLFGYQQFQLSGLQSEWGKMKPKVTELDDLQVLIKKYRPWYDETLPSLNILRRVTEAFPEDGVVSAKMIEIRNVSAVSCTGTAGDNPSLLKTMDRLRTSKQVSDVRVDQIKGKSPMQFTLNFRWTEAP